MRKAINVGNQRGEKKENTRGAYLTRTPHDAEHHFTQKKNPQHDIIEGDPYRLCPRNYDDGLPILEPNISIIYRN